MTNSVAQRTEASADMLKRAQKGRDLTGGTDAMQAAGEAYLPKFSAEDAVDYSARVKSSWLFNAYAKTVSDMAGKVFQKPVEVDASGNNEITGWLENVDMQGRDLSAFAKDVFDDGFDCGVSWIMVDAPRRDAEVTRTQAEQGNLRPFLVHLRVEDILGWRIANINNATVLSQLRIAESVEVDDPKDEFACKVVERVRVLELTEVGVRVRIFRKDDGSYTLDEDYLTALREITVVPFYAKRTGFFTGKPPLEDLADLNLAHWRSQSDQTNILHFARVPALFGAGFDGEEGRQTLSAASMFTANSPQAKLEWVEHGGKAIEAGRQSLKDIEGLMRVMGLQLLVERTQSATGAALDASKETSQLAAMADSLKDALEQALFWMAEYGGLSIASMSVTVNKEYGVTMLTPQEVTAMLAAVNTGNMSQQTFLRELARRGFIAPDTDIKAEIDAIDQEPPDLNGVLTDG